MFQLIINNKYYLVYYIYSCFQIILYAVFNSIVYNMQKYINISYVTSLKLIYYTCHRPYGKLVFLQKD
jgi:hypothetical protein